MREAAGKVFNQWGESHNVNLRIDPVTKGVLDPSAITYVFAFSHGDYVQYLDQRRALHGDTRPYAPLLNMNTAQKLVSAHIVVTHGAKEREDYWGILNAIKRKYTNNKVVAE